MLCSSYKSIEIVDSSDDELVGEDIVDKAKIKVQSTHRL